MPDTAHALPDPTPDRTSDPTPDRTPDPTPDLTPDPQPASAIGEPVVPGAATSSPPDGGAAGPPDGEAPTGRERLLGALRRPGSRGQVLVGVLLAAVGFGAVVQLHELREDDSFTGARQSDLIALINTLSLATDRAETEIRDLQRTRDSLLNDTEATQTAIDRAREEADTLGILAGTRPAVGPGVRITVKGPAGAVGTDQLLNGLEELRNAGAEAIEIGDTVRVVAQTSITDSPERGVVVDGVQLQPPYVIEAIGDPDTLATAMEFEGGFAETVQQLGGSFRVEKLDDVEIASTRETPEFRFAEPVQQE